MHSLSEAIRLYLESDGWVPRSKGGVGELWHKDGSDLPVPFELKWGTEPAIQILSSIARVRQEQVDVVESGVKSLMRADGENVKESATPRYERAEMDLHLDGATVRNHETNAYDFGTLVVALSESVKELSKSIRGSRKGGRSLVISGGAGEGSVRLTVREPDRSDTSAIIASAPETIEGKALMFLGALLRAAESAAVDDNSTDLVAYLDPLPTLARKRLRILADSITAGQWIVWGSVRGGGESERLKLTLRGASALSRASQASREMTTRRTIRGTADGWSWSQSSLALESDSLGLLRLRVPAHLQSRVAELVVERQTSVDVTVDVYERFASGSNLPISTTYSLVDIGYRDERELDI